MRLSVTDVDLLIALEETEALRRWRARLRTLEIVRVERLIWRNVLSSETEWVIELRDAEGWRQVTGQLALRDAIDLGEFIGELGALAATVPRERLRVLVASLVRRDLRRAQETLDDAVWAAPAREARGGEGA